MRGQGNTWGDKMEWWGVKLGDILLFLMHLWVESNKKMWNGLHYYLKF